MKTRPRGTAAIEKLVVHTNEGPEDSVGAAGLVGYLRTIDAGYHAVIDNDSTVVAAQDNLIVEGAGGMNTHALHVCLIGRAGQTAQEWEDLYSRGELDQLCAWLAQKARQYQIPIWRLSPPQVASTGTKGICGHADVHDPRSEGHYDPGPNFPWANVLIRVAALLIPEPKVKPMFWPHLEIAAALSDQQGGFWLARDDGTVLHVDKKGGTIEGGMVSPADRKAFAGRHVQSLVLRYYRPKGKMLKRPGYKILTTDGNKVGYIPSAQH